MATVDAKTAALILERALIEAQLTDDSKAQKIDAILCGSHKTYRYILVTALLGKATNADIDILSLQANDGTKGSMMPAHSVIMLLYHLRPSNFQAA